MQRNHNPPARLHALYTTNRGGATSLGWIKEDFSHFFRVRNERTPAVIKASRALQDVMDIAPGTRIVGTVPAVLWQMPVPPMQTIKEMCDAFGRRIEALTKKAGPAGSEKVAGGEEGVSGDDIEDADETVSEDDDETVVSDESEGADELLWIAPQDQDVNGSDDEQGLLCESDDDLLWYPPAGKGLGGGEESRPLKRKAQDTSPAQDHSTERKAKRMKIENPSAATTHHLPPASPPPNWLPHPRGPYIRNLPAYWSHTLSQHLNRWLEEHGTQSSQTVLRRLVLGSHSAGRGANVAFSMNARDCAKMKLSSLKLPMSVAAAMGHGEDARPVEWIVLQINYHHPGRYGGADEYDEGHDKDPFIPLPTSSTAIPYSVIAFPKQAITESRTVYQRFPAASLPPRPQGRKSGVRKEMGMWVTTMVLGQRGRVPLVHGRGVNAKFADGFVQACAVGEAAMELWSREPLTGGIVAVV